MLGTMQDWPLLVWKLIDHAAIYHPTREIVSLTCEGPKHRTNWAEVRGRARQVSGALRRLGIETSEVERAAGSGGEGGGGGGGGGSGSNSSSNSSRSQDPGPSPSPSPSPSS